MLSNTKGHLGNDGIFFFFFHWNKMRMIFKSKQCQQTLLQVCHYQWKQVQDHPLLHHVHIKSKYQTAETQYQHYQFKKASSNSELWFHGVQYRARYLNQSLKDGWKDTNIFQSEVTITTNNSLQYQAAWGQHSYTYSSSNLIYSRPLYLRLPRKFPFPLNLYLWHPPTPDDDDLLSV